MTIFVEPDIAIYRRDGEDINKQELLDLVEHFCEWLESNGYESGGRWKLTNDINELLEPYANSPKHGDTIVCMDCLDEPI